MANTASILLVGLLVIAVIAMMATTVDTASDQQEAGIAYCQDTYADTYAEVVWLQQGETYELHCQLDNGTLVEVPDKVVG